jgi:hypothetical protein
VALTPWPLAAARPIPFETASGGDVVLFAEVSRMGRLTLQVLEALWYLSRLKYDLISSAYADLEVVIESHNESLKQALQLLRDLPNVQV